MWISVRKKCKRFFLKYNRYARHENCSPSLDLLIVYKSKNLAVWSDPRERERIIEEETRRTTAPRDLEPRLTMQLTVVHRGGSHAGNSFDPFEDSSALRRRETIYASMTKARRVFFFLRNQPFDTSFSSFNQGLAFVDRTGDTYFVQTVVISVSRLSFCESNRASR